MLTIEEAAAIHKLLDDAYEPLMQAFYLAVGGVSGPGASRNKRLPAWGIHRQIVIARDAIASGRRRSRRFINMTQES